MLGRVLPVTVIQGSNQGVEQKNGRLYVTLKNISDGDKRRQLVQKISGWVVHGDFLRGIGQNVSAYTGLGRKKA
ncbi:MAG: hypothetical protein ACLTV1_05455 [Christensenellales bacterium]